MTGLESSSKAASGESKETSRELMQVRPLTNHEAIA